MQYTQGEPVAQPHSTRPKVSVKTEKKVNKVFAFLSAAIIIGFFLYTLQISTLFSGIFTFLNVWFLLAKKESKISFLRCRVCCVYVWFGFIIFF